MYHSRNAFSKGHCALGTFSLLCLFSGFACLVCCGRGDGRDAKAVTSGSSGGIVEQASSLRPADEADVSSMDGVVAALYESITFREGGKPDMERFRSLFSPRAQFIRITPEGVMKMDCDGFVANFSERVQTGILKSFYETEIARKTQRFGSIAQVFTAYTKGANTEDPNLYSRGINGLQMFYEGDRWWISSLVWQDESEENPIPEEYLR